MARRLILTNFFLTWVAKIFKWGMMGESAAMWGYRGEVHVWTLTIEKGERD